MFELLRLILAALLLLGGVGCMLLSLLGVFRFRFVLNRLQSAAVVDSLGMLLVVLGLALAAWSLDFLPKLLLLLALLWLGSPVAARLVARMELSTDEDAHNHMDREDRA